MTTEAPPNRHESSAAGDDGSRNHQAIDIPARLNATPLHEAMLAT